MATAVQAREGHVEVTGGRIWYRVVGDTNATPLVTVHGGPGATHDYLEPLQALADERPVVFYDQLGAGRSDVPDDLGLWTNDTAAFAVQTLRRWWQQVGRLAYPQATRLLVCADAGGSNGDRVRAWKTELAGSPPRPGWRSPRVTCRRGPPRGTGSSIGWSARSR
jgi:Rhodopirellula transposase DDE domain